MAAGNVGGERLGRQHDRRRRARRRGVVTRRGLDGERQPWRSWMRTPRRSTAAPATAWASRSGWTAAQCGVYRRPTCPAGARQCSASSSVVSQRRSSAPRPNARASSMLGRQAGVLGGCAGERDRAALAEAGVVPRRRAQRRPRRPWRASPAAWRSPRRARAGRPAASARRQQRRAPPAVAAAGAEADVLALEHGDAQRRVAPRRGTAPSTARCSRRRRWPRRRRCRRRAGVAATSGRPASSPPTTSLTHGAIVAPHRRPIAEPRRYAAAVVDPGAGRPHRALPPPSGPQAGWYPRPVRPAGRALLRRPHVDPSHDGGRLTPAVPSRTAVLPLGWPSVPWSCWRSR